MERFKIGEFYAIAFDGTVYTFTVYEDGLACHQLGAEQIRVLFLNPRMNFYDVIKDDFINIPEKAGYMEGLIKTYDIEPKLLWYLKSQNLIRYSTDMAYLYDFDDKEGYDRVFQRAPFKRVKNKQKILEKQKQGIFN